MKRLLILAIIAAAGWLAWKSHRDAQGPEVIDHPVYAEMRVTTILENRAFEFALFIRSSDVDDCRTRARRSWEKTLAACATCRFTEPTCQEKLPPRYARLFDDVPIPSTYLSATRGTRGERDGRLVVYGLTDQEGEFVCEQMKSKILENYQGTAHCVRASGG